MIVSPIRKSLPVCDAERLHQFSRIKPRLRSGQSDGLWKPEPFTFAGASHRASSFLKEAAPPVSQSCAEGMKQAGRSAAAGAGGRRTCTPPAAAVWVTLPARAYPCSRRQRPQQDRGAHWKSEVCQDRHLGRSRKSRASSYRSQSRRTLEPRPKTCGSREH